MKELICIVCPKGCRLTVDEFNGYKVTGNACQRGAAYGYKELTNPTRVLTTTVKIQGGPPVSYTHLDVYKRQDTTSAVDLETEKYIQQQLADLPFSCTKIIIAQRISSVKNADKIMILADGRIAEMGTHCLLYTSRCV